MVDDYSHVVAVIFVIFCPMVSFTLRPNIHKPVHMPSPPYSKSKRGVSDFWRTEPSWKISQIAIKGPIALLQMQNTIRKGR